MEGTVSQLVPWSLRASVGREGKVNSSIVSLREEKVRNSQQETKQRG